MSTLQARNEAIINAPGVSIWAIITDITSLEKVNPGVVKASGRMDIQGATGAREINSNGSKGTMVVCSLFDAKIMDGLMIKGVIPKAQEQMLPNIKSMS